MTKKENQQKKKARSITDGLIIHMVIAFHEIMTRPLPLNQPGSRSLVILVLILIISDDLKKALTASRPSFRQKKEDQSSSESA